MAKNEIFRKSSLDRVSSPEKLNDYIKVSNPSVWAVILAIIVMIAVAFIWATVGRLPTTVSSIGILSGQNFENKDTDSVICFFTEADITGETRSAQESATSRGQKDIPMVKVGQKVEISPSGSNSKKDGTIEGTITSIDTSPTTIEELVEETKSPALGSQLIKESYGYKALIEMKKSGTGYKWSKKETSQKIDLKPGTICKLSIFTEEATPMDFLIN